MTRMIFSIRVPEARLSEALTTIGIPTQMCPPLALSTGTTQQFIYELDSAEALDQLCLRVLRYDAADEQLQDLLRRPECEGCGGIQGHAYPCTAAPKGWSSIDTSVEHFPTAEEIEAQAEYQRLSQRIRAAS